MKNILIILSMGILLAGQAWTTFADLEAFPNVLNFQGPNSFFGTRQPLIRWTWGIAKDLKISKSKYENKTIKKEKQDEIPVFCGHIPHCGGSFSHCWVY